MNDREERILWVNEFFQCIDNREFSSILKLVANDIVYERPGFPTIKGKDNLLDFYTNKRSVVDGKHTVTNVISDVNFTAFSGFFSGRLKNNEFIELYFCDVCQFEGRLLKKRKTFFYSPMI